MWTSSPDVEGVFALWTVLVSLSASFSPRVLPECPPCLASASPWRSWGPSCLRSGESGGPRVKTGAALSDVRAQREARGGCGWAYGLCMRRPRGKGVSEHRPGSSERANIPGRPTVQGLGGRTVPFAKLGK